MGSENHSTLPKFSSFEPDSAVAAVRELLTQNRAEVAAIIDAAGDQPTWKNLVEPLDLLGDRLSKAISPVSHLNSVCNSDALRDAYNGLIPELSRYWTEMAQNRPMFEAYRKLRDGDAWGQLSADQQKVVENNLRDFRLSGIDLPDEKRARYAELQERLSTLSTQFANNLMDATDGWSKLITDVTVLAGLPDSALAAAKQMADSRGEQGWMISLDFPSYFAVITYADDAELRREVYEAFVTRASDTGPGNGQWDNTEVMEEILTLRRELAQLLGFESFADYSLATKMADSPAQVISFLEDLAQKSRPQALADKEELVAYARDLGIDPLNSWDVSYVSEKLKQEKYQVSQEAIRPYFPLPTVQRGLFEIANRLFGVEITEVAEFDRWHADARLFNVSRNGELIARFFLDPFAREKKRGGAWMDVCHARMEQADGSIQLPVAYLVCNFNPPVGDQPALLTHNEVTTLFHEFGHGLHHMLTQVRYADISGISGVAWDAVELPSQFMENWCWEREGLQLISGHFETGEALPDEMLDKMLAAKNFQSALMMVRQLEFSLFDIRLYSEYTPGETSVQALLDQVRAQVAVLIPPAFNRFQHSFSHIFGGGYAAGYYSYKWAEVLSADAFARFEEEGIFNPATGAEFLTQILEKGGSKEPMELFKAFRGREPEVDALLRHSGIQA